MPFNGVLWRIGLYFLSARVHAQDATKFNNAELSRFSLANSNNAANNVPATRIEFTADRACIYVSERATGQSAQRVRVHGQSAVVTPQVNLSFSFLTRSPDM